jgi:hypothetical protein
LNCRGMMQHFKEQCHEIFCLWFFSSNNFSWYCMLRNDSEFFRIFVELFLFVIDSPVMNTPGSRLESLRFNNFCKHKSMSLGSLSNPWPIFRIIDPLKIVKNYSPVYSSPGSLDSPMMNTPWSLDSPVMKTSGSRLRSVL